VDEGIRHYREQLLPEARRMADLGGPISWLTARAAGMWDHAMDAEKNLQASAVAASRLRAGGAEAIAASKPPVVEIYEVVVQP